MPMRSIGITLLICALGLGSLVLSPQASSEPNAKGPKGPSPECLRAAAAKELGAAARERFLASCNPASSSKELDEGSSTELDTKPKLSDKEKDRVEYCTSVAAGRNLSGGSRDHFLRDCLSGY